MFEKYLQDIGLNDKEAAVYLALLSHENTSVLELAKKTSIKRPTVYTALESLAKKGLVSEILLGKKTHYQAELPEKLETFIEKKILALKDSQKTLKEVIPQLRSLPREHGEKPVVKYFEGKEGILSSTDETLRSSGKAGEPMYFIYPRDLLEELFSADELQSKRQTRLNKAIKSRSLYTYTKGDLGSNELADRIKIDGNKYPITCDITIYNDTVRISTLGKKLSSIFIRSQDIADTFKSLFKLAYDNKK